jgi:DNA-binding MarR family transcriptional regulator
MASGGGAGPADAPQLRLEAFLPYRLSVASNAVSRLIARAYQRRFGLSIPEWRLLAVIHDHPGSTQQDLVGRTLMDKVAVSRSAGALERRGLIARTTDSVDGRAWRLSLTAEGSALHGAVAPLALAYEARLLEGLGPGGAERLSAMLRIIEDAAQQLD